MQRLRIALIALHSRYCHSALAPWCLLAGIREYGQEDVAPAVIEGTVNESDEALLSRLRDAQVLCFCCYIWNITTVLRLAQQLKAEDPSRRIVLGGPEVAYRAAEVLAQYPFVDCIVVGEGEYPIARLTDALAADRPIDGIEGVYTRAYAAEPYLPQTVPPSPYVPAYFDTLNGLHTYQVVAVFLTTASVGQGFPYHSFINAKDADDFDRFISGCKRIALYDTGVTAEYGDKLITLSTCEFSQTNGRLAIVAKRIG